MSLFIGGLSFDSQENMNAVRLGVLAGSGISGILGYAVLLMSGKRDEEAVELAESGHPAPAIHN